nr:retrovirus-related Pol polyprotein from transposon TNT 1-94 [Tanacetum cinerariifolium]
MSVDIKFYDDLQALLLLSLLPESWLGTVTPEDIHRVLELLVKCKRQRHRQKAKQRAEAEQKDTEVNMAVRDMMTHWFKLRSGKVRLADDKTLDIAGVGDVVLKTSFGTSWNLKDVREYSSQEFIEYCSKNRIRMLKTVPETPHQNNVDERMNRTLNERKKSMVSTRLGLLTLPVFVPRGGGIGGRGGGIGCIVPDMIGS